MTGVVDTSKLWTKALKKNYGSRQVVCGTDPDRDCAIDQGLAGGRVALAVESIPLSGVHESSVHGLLERGLYGRVGDRFDHLAP